MLYPNLKFSKSPKGRPFFYTNFVQTVDGKVSVSEDGYWPIGSKFDHQVLIELRSYADCLIHGGNLAKEFGEATKKSLNEPNFKNIRIKIGKTPDLPYYVATRDLESLIKTLQNNGYKHILVEGGPTLLGSFLEKDLIDEIFLTIAPKIYGSKPNSTKTLVEGILLPPNKFKLKLISVKKIKDELFLRYSLKI